MAGEKQLQQFIVKKSRERGILVYKFASPGHRGVPDLICIPPGRPAYFIEVKNPNGKGRLSGLQELTIEKINRQGTKAYVIDNKERALEIIRLNAQTGGGG